VYKRRKKEEEEEKKRGIQRVFDAHSCALCG